MSGHRTSDIVYFMPPDQPQQNVIERKQSTAVGVSKAVQVARTKLLINTHDNNVNAEETSDDYIRRKWHDYCVQAAAVSAHDLVQNHKQDYQHIILLASHGQEGDYVGPSGDSVFTGHMICLCEDVEGKWVSLSPTTYNRDNPTDPSSSIHTEKSLSGLLQYLGQEFGGQWPSEEDISSNYQSPSVDVDEDSEAEGHSDTIRSLKITWVQKDHGTTFISQKSLPVSREITNPGSMTREYLYRHDFYTPQE